MNNVKKALACGILFTFCAVLLTACGGGGGGNSLPPPPPPPPPVAPVTAATPVLTFESVKTFRFSWTDVSDATHYKLLENPDNHSGFTQVGNDIPQGSQSVDHVVPLYARLNAQYLLQSCNASGCTSSSNVSVSGTMVGSIGYVKASNTDADDKFGASVALSADGNTLAVGANFEDSNVMGIDGNQADNTASKAGAVYVFKRDGGSWSQQAYVKASNAEAEDQFGASVALSADGNTLAVGAKFEDGVDNNANSAGAVYVFSRDAAGVWGGTPAYVKASNTEALDFFGTSLALSADGDTLAVGATSEDSSAMDIDGDQADNTASRAGAVYVFNRDGGRWSQQAYVKASNTETNDDFGIAVALSANGNTLAVGATGEDGAGINGNNNDQGSSGAVYVYRRDADGEWSDAYYIKASTVADNIHANDEFGTAIALSADGNTLAVGAIGESSSAIGIDGIQADETANEAGAVYVFSRDGNGKWGGTPTYIKASNTEADDVFGSSVALSADGNTLAVGATGEDSRATGIDGDQGDNTARAAGALYVYIRDGGNWSQQAYVKASNTEADDAFGGSVVLSADGNPLAVGVVFEDSKAAGIDGDQADNNALIAGAVYLY